MFLDKTNITSITIGGFDGMHLAHQKLFTSLDKKGAIVVIDTGYASLTPNNYRQEYTKYPVFYYKLKDIKHLSGEEFIKLLKNDFLNLNKIIVGFDFCFGKDRKYNISSLKRIFKNEVKVIEEISFENIPIHSRIIRQYLKDGNIKVVNELLGREYKIYGTQIKGQGLGSKNFVPTINLRIDTFTLPKEGVYITKTLLDNIEYSSVTFLGHRVTTDGSYAIETHILDKNILNSKEKVAIKFLYKIRDNKKFDSYEGLKNEIEKDIKKSKDFFKKNLKN